MRLLTAEEAGEFLSISRSKIYAMKDKGILPYYPIEGSLRFAESDLLAYLDRIRVENEPKPQRKPRPRLKHIKLA